MIVLIILFIILFFGFSIIDKTKELNIDNIIENGSLINEMTLKTEVFYKCMANKITENKLSHLVYLRAEDGKEIVIDNSDVYFKLNIGNTINLKKEIYCYKSQKLSFYSILIDDFENLRFCEELDFIN